MSEIYWQDAKGRKEPPRAYSMCSTPDEPDLAITVKEETYTRGQTKYPPLLSPLLASGALKGREMVITGGESRMFEWQKHLYSLLSRNARPVRDYYRLPPMQIIEVGLPIQL